MAKFPNLTFGGSGQKFAFKSLGDDGEVVAAVTGAKIRVLAMYASCDDTNEVVSVYLEDGTTQIGPKFLVGVKQQVISDSYWNSDSDVAVVATLTNDIPGHPPYLLPFSPAGWCETSSGAALNAEFSAALTGGKVEFMLVYEEVPG